MSTKVKYFSVFLLLLLFTLAFGQLALKGNIDRSALDEQKGHNKSMQAYYQQLFQPQNEIVSMRDLMQKTYLAEDSSFVSKITLYPQHYLNDQGQWQEVDATLTAGGSGYAYSNATNTVQSFFPSQGGETVTIRHHASGLELGWNTRSISYTNSLGEQVLLSKSKPVFPQLISNRLYYKQIFPHVSEEYLPVDNGLRHEFTLAREALIGIQPPETFGPLHTLNVEFVLVNPSQLTLTPVEAGIEKLLEPSNEIIVSQGQENLFRLLPPFVQDAYGQKVAAKYVLEGNRLFIRIPLEWVMDPQRQFPLKIDPETTIYCNTFSGFVWRHWEEDFWGDCNDESHDYYSNMIMSGRGANNGIETNECAEVFGCDHSKDEDRGFAEFDISSINDIFDIVDVDLNFYVTEVCADPVGSYTTLYFYNMAYQPSTAGNSTRWNDAADGTQYASLTVDDPDDDVGWQMVDLGTSGNNDLETRLTANWFAVGFDNYFVSESNSYDDEVKLRGHYYSDYSYHPYLIIRYSYDADGYETDNSCSDYTTITVAASLQGQNHAVSPWWDESNWQYDYDYYRFYADCGRTFYFYSNNNYWASSYYTDTYGELLTDDCGTVLAYNDDGGGSLNFSLSWCCTAAGYYKFRVRGYSTSSFGPYRINYYYTSPVECNQDGYESDNSCETAIPISAGGNSPNHTINQEGADNDWFSFTVPYISNFSCYTDGSAGDTRMWLYRGSCPSPTQIAYNDNGGTSSFSRIDATCQPAGQYYIRVNGNGNVCSYTLYLSAFTDMRISTPSLSSPANGGRTFGNSVNFSWNVTSGATGYRLYVNGTNVYDGGNIVYNGYPTTDCNDYTWYVQAYNSCTSANSATYSFRENGRPSVPTMLSPSSGSRNTGNVVTLNWGTSTDCDGDTPSYYVYWGTAPPPSFYDNVSGNSVDITTVDCVTYYWSVQAYDGYETSSMASTWNVVENGRPSTPTLLVPADGDSLEPESHVLTWNPSTDCNSDPVTYTWFVDYEDPPAVPYFASGTTIETFTTPINLAPASGNWMYWRVFPSDGHESGFYSDTWEFFVMFPKSEVIVETDIAGGIVTVDGTDYFSPFTALWVIGSVHEIGVPSPQLVSGGVRYIYDSWSDGGTIIHDIVVPDVDITYTAYMLPQYWVTVTNSPLAAGDGQVKVDGVPETAPYMQWWTGGTSHSLGVYDSFTVGGTRYIWLNWSDGGARTHSVTPVAPTSYTANFQTQYYLSVENGGHGSVTGSGWYAAGSNPTFSSDTLADVAGGERFRFEGWSGYGTGSYTGDDNPATCVMNAPITEVAQWIHQYRFIVSNPDGYDNPFPSPGIYWIDSSMSVDGYCHYIDYDDHVYCVGYIGTGSLGFGSDTTFDFIINSPSTVEWQWAEMLPLFVSSEYGTPTPTGTTYYIPGSTVNASAPEMAYFGTDIRALCLGWTAEGSPPAAGDTNWFSFVIDETSSIEWLWQVQYRLVVNNPGGYDSPVPPAGEHWYDEGVEVSGYINLMDDTMYCIGYTATGVLTSAPGTTFTYINTGPATVTWNWSAYTAVTQLTVISEYPYCFPPPGLYYYSVGATVNAIVTPAIRIDPVNPGIRYVCLGYLGTGSAPDSGETNMVSFIIEEPSTLTWLWVMQYRFIVDNPEGVGDPNPEAGTHWYDEGAEVSGNVTSPAGSLYCLGYLGTGSLTDGFNTSFLFIIEEPSSITWLWGTARSPLVVYSDYGTPNPPVGLNYFGTGTDVFATSGPPDYLTPGERMLCVGWTGTGSVPPTGDEGTVEFTIEDSSTITWLWQLQYRLTVVSAHGTPSPGTGQHWYDEGAGVDGWVSLMVVEGSDTFWCSGYDGEGSLGDAGDTSFSFNINEPTTVEWLWVLSENAVVLDIFSAHGSPFPSRGRHYYLAGTLINAFVPSPSYEGDGVRWICTGWTATGSPPATGDSNHITFTLDDTSAITWNWRREFRFTVTSDYGAPDPAVGEHWYNPGTGICGWVNRMDGMMVCVGYSGEGTLSDGIDTTFCFFLDTVSAIQWNWMLFTDVVSLTVESDYSYPYPGTGIHYYAPGTEITAFLPDTLIDMGETRALYANWVGTGSPPVYGEDTTFTFTIDENSGINWEWYLQHYLEIDFTGCGTFIPAQIGEGWYDQGTVVDIYSDSLTGAGDEWYVFSHWSIDPSGGSLSDTFHHESQIEVDTAYDLTAEYGVALALIVRKAPIHHAGYIMIDSVYYFDSPAETLWVSPGTYHQIEVSTADSTDTTRYYFLNWIGFDDEPSMIVGPIVSDTMFTAYYRSVHHVLVRKEPFEECGWLVVDRDHWIGPGSGQQEYWWEEGSNHLIEASETDYCGDSIIYEFTGWSDGGEWSHWTGSIMRHRDFVASYTTQYHCWVRKEPPHYGGELRIGDSVWLDIPEKDFWAWEDSSYFIGVSEFGLDRDFLYIFLNWSHGGPLEHFTPPIEAPTVFQANYEELEVVVEVCIAPNEWHIDSIDPGEERTMTEFEAIQVENCGSIPISLGLRVEDSGPYWMPGYLNGYDIYILRARFEEGTAPPAEFHSTMDYLKEYTTWATADLLGPVGYDLDVGEIIFLWMQFIAPVGSRVYMEEQVITVEMRLTVSLP
ncbi:PPC domain-containing protein [bacterium]|nr:PPC domain-containing protein [bacterium]